MGQKRIKREPSQAQTRNSSLQVSLSVIPVSPKAHLHSWEHPLLWLQESIPSHTRSHRKGCWGPCNLARSSSTSRPTSGWACGEGIACVCFSRNGERLKVIAKAHLRMQLCSEDVTLCGKQLNSFLKVFFLLLKALLPSWQSVPLSVSG